MKAVNLKQRIIGAVVLIGLAVIFLPMLLNENKNPSMKLQQIPDRPDQPEIQAPAQIPKVQPTPVTQIKPTTAAWTLQLGAFGSKKNADKLLTRLQKAGYNAYADVVQGQAGEIIKIYVGPSIDKMKLQVQAATLEKRFKLKGRVVTYKAVDHNLSVGQ